MIVCTSLTSGGGHLLTMLLVISLVRVRSVLVFRSLVFGIFGIYYSVF